MRVILFRPQIPQNTGNIVRTCAVTGCELLLVTPLGFSTSSRMLRRAGLDYWENVTVTLIDDLSSYLEREPHPFYFFSSKASQPYTAAEYGANDCLIFGSETTGLAPEFRERWPQRFLTVPQREGPRCLNLASCAAVVIYEAWRQQQFQGAAGS